MSDSDRSSDYVSDDSQGTIQDSKPDFTEDEETLIARMFNLLGESCRDPSCPTVISWDGWPTHEKMHLAYREIAHDIENHGYFSASSSHVQGWYHHANYLAAHKMKFQKVQWSLIAGRIPGRTAEEIEKYWTSRYSSSE